MKFGSIIIIISALVYVKGSQEVCIKIPKEDKNLVELISSIRQFSTIFVKYVRENQSGNYAVSPLSLHLALGIITIGSGSSTSTELHNVLGTNNFKHRLIEDYEKLSEKLWTTYFNLRLSQKIWLFENFIPKATFLSLLRKGFKNAPISVFNFSNTHSTVAVLNLLSQSFYMGNFTNLTQLGEVPRNTSLIISSILNFKGVMPNSLKVKHIELRKFFVNEIISNQVPMMHVHGLVIHGFLPKIRASFIKYEIKAKELSMIIIHPHEIRDFGKVDEQLDNINISEILEHGNLVNMSFFIPKFKIENNFELKEIIKKMGVLQIFDKSANLSGISDQGLKVDRIIHKILIDINEDGATIAGSTDIRYSKRFPRNITESFDVNSPFHFAILHEQTKLPLVRGRVMNPLSN